jgi:hypothetical protein
MYSKKPSFNLNVLVYKEDKVWIAHCLELDIITADPSQSTVEKDIVDLVHAQIRSAYESGNTDAIFTPAPSEDWAKLYSASKKCNVKKIEKVDKSSIAGVKLCFA